MTPSELCPLVWTADRGAIMDGWSEPERDDKGPIRWTISRAAHLSLPARCDGPLLLRVVAAVSDRKVEGLQPSVNGRALEAELDSQALSAPPLPELQIRVNQLDKVPGPSRQFGIAVRRIEVLPRNDDQKRSQEIDVK